MKEEGYTENLADFGMREIKLLGGILSAWLKAGLPEDFGRENVRPAFNRNSGYVFLTNEDSQVVMAQSERGLALWHTCPNCGYEGFEEDCKISEEHGDCNMCEGKI